MLEKKHSNILLGSSFSILVLALFLYYLDFTQVSILYFILFLTSINHWKNPGYNIKRQVDIYMVVVTTAAGMVYAAELNSDLDHYMYHITAFYTLILFIFSNLFFAEGYFLTSTLFHSKIHLICLIGNCMMFYCLKTERDSVAIID